MPPLYIGVAQYVGRSRVVEASTFYQVYEHRLIACPVKQVLVSDESIPDMALSSGICLAPEAAPRRPGQIASSYRAGLSMSCVLSRRHCTTR